MIDDIKPPKRRYTISGSGAVGDRLREQSEPRPPAVSPIPLQADELPQPSHHSIEQPIVQRPVKKRRIRKLLFGSKKRFTLTLLVFLLIGANILAAYVLTRPDKPLAPLPAVTKKAPPPKPTTIPSPLTGLLVKPELARRPVTAVMIENSPDARPQSGLRDAGVVFEAIAEGGITRFLTLFQEYQPGYLGPVRSIRPYYLDWAVPFDAAIAHVGGSLDARQQVQNEGIKNMDQFFNPGTYWRISERYAPHNVYTNFERIDALNKAKGYTKSTFTNWPRKQDKKLKTPTAKSITFDISGFLYNPHYDYDPKTNSYMRSQGGQPHVDVLSQTDGAPYQHRPRVVIAMVVPFNVVLSSDGYRGEYAVNGSGPAYVFQDGGVQQVTWTKVNRKDQIRFKDAAGKAVPLNAGQTWISMVSAAGEVQYTP